MDLVRRMLGRWVPEAFVLDDATGLMLYRRVSGTPLQARLAAGTVSATHVEVIGAHLGRFVRDIAGLDANAVDGVIVDDTSLNRSVGPVDDSGDLPVAGHACPHTQRSRRRARHRRRRALFYARCLAVEDMAYAVRRRRDLIELDRRNIERLFASS
jgi:hypothetical protein